MDLKPFMVLPTLARKPNVDKHRASGERTSSVKCTCSREENTRNKKKQNHDDDDDDDDDDHHHHHDDGIHSLPVLLYYYHCSSHLPLRLPLDRPSASHAQTL